MGLLDMVKNVVSNKDNITAAMKLMNGKVDAKSLAKMFATYLVQSKLASSQSAAQTEGNSFANQVASIVNLSQCSGISDVLSKLQSSTKPESNDLASKLGKAVDVIKMFNNKA